VSLLHQLNSVFRTGKMLTRSLKVSPSMLLLIILLAFCGWQLSQGQGPKLQRVESALGFQTSLQAERTGKPRIAIITFVTGQKSYVHLSLKSKDRKLTASRMELKDTNSLRLRTAPRLRLHRRL
jgi:hypothetical protein